MTRKLIRRPKASATYQFPTASDEKYAYPGRRPNGDPWVEALRQGAVDFWRSRNVYAEGASVDVADDLLYPGAAGLGRAAERGAILNSDLVGTYLANARNEKYSTRGRRRNLNRVGELIAHEVGHAAGLGHTEDGLMAPSSTLGPMDPAVMQSLVRKLIPRDTAPNAHERSVARKQRNRYKAASRPGSRRIEG